MHTCAAWNDGNEKVKTKPVVDVELGSELWSLLKIIMYSIARALKLILIWYGVIPMSFRV